MTDYTALLEQMQAWIANKEQRFEPEALEIIRKCLPLVKFAAEDNRVRYAEPGTLDFLRCVPVWNPDLLWNPDLPANWYRDTD